MCDAEIEIGTRRGEESSVSVEMVGENNGKSGKPSRHGRAVWLHSVVLAYLCNMGASELVKKEMAWPFLPARPVRPTR